MTYIKNRDEILSVGNSRLKKDMLNIIEEGLYDADPYIQTKKFVKLEGSILKFDDLSFNLEEVGNVYVIGAGKATYPIGKALNEILLDKIKDGIITCKHGHGEKLSNLRLYNGNHPVPDENGIKSSKEMLKIAKKTKKNDLVIFCITGGSTSLMPLPIDGISLKDLIKTYDILLKSSANVIEMNAVRKHLSKIKGGRLAESIHPGADIVNITVSDVIGDKLDYITGPTVPDSSTLDDARATLDKYRLWDKLPYSVRNFLKNAGEEFETPKYLSDHKIHNFMIVKGDAACEGSLRKAKELGYNSIILSSMFEGESKDIGAAFAAIGKEISEKNRPLNPPAVVIGGGETTMKITGNAGRGGPNQQFALAAASYIDGYEDILIGAIDTDGIDGASDLAGGIVDGNTMKQAAKENVDIFKHIENFDDTPALKKLKSGILTGHTGTNVNDLKILLVGKK